MKQILLLSSMSAVNIGIAFLFQWYVFFYLGPGPETDALFAGMTIPQLVLTVISASLMHVLVPMMAGESDKKLKEDAWNFFYLITVLFGALAIILYITSALWVPILFPGFEDDLIQLTIDLTHIQLLGMVFSAVNGVQLATYHAKQHFILPEFSLVLTGLVGISLLIWALPRYGVLAAAYINVLRFALQTIILMPFLGKPTSPDLTNENILQAWKRIKPLLIGTTYYKTDPLIDRFLLSTVTPGTLSLYYIAQQIYGAAHQVFNKAIITPFVPSLSQCYKLGDHRLFMASYYRKLLRTSMLIFLSFLTIAVFGWVITEYFHLTLGHSGDDDLRQLWWILIWLGGMYIGGALGLVTSSAYYASGNTSTPTKVSVFSYTIYIPVKVICFYFFGVVGMAISTSVYYLINLFLQIYLLRK